MIDRDALQRYGLLTGSVAFGVSGPDSDEDWLISIDDVSKTGVDEEDLDGDYPSDFFTYREGRVNLIVWCEESFRDNWLVAHNRCLIERPADKARRIEIFKECLYGESAA
jgi:hypothetical protein